MYVTIRTKVCFYLKHSLLRPEYHNILFVYIMCNFLHVRHALKKKQCYFNFTSFSSKHMDIVGGCLIYRSTTHI